MVERIFLIRHGLRMDMEQPDWKHTAKRPHDPPLTANGWKQAQETADFVRHEGIGAIFSSPFLRTLQTASSIAADVQAPILVESGFTEFLHPDSFASMPDIITREEALRLFSCIDDAYHSYASPIFPEDSEDTHVFARVATALEHILGDYLGTIAIVTHRTTMQQVAEALGIPHASIDNRTCGVNQLQFRGGVWCLIHAGNNHLSVTEADLGSRVGSFAP